MSAPAQDLTSPTKPPAASARGFHARLAGRLLRGLVALSLLIPVAGCARALNAVTSGAGYQVVRDLRYAPHERGTFDLYVPDTAGPRSPLVVFVHGGSWDSGSKDMYLFVGQSLASQGILVAIPNYRLYPDVRFPTFVEDAAAATAEAVAVVRSGAHGVTAGDHPVILMGHSAGAEIAGLLATDARYLDATDLGHAALAGFIGLAGPYDFLPLTDARYKRIFPEATREESQPIAYLDAGDPPMLLIAGDADTTVDPKNTRSMAAKARAAGVAVTERIVPDVDHVGAITAFATALPLGDPQIRQLALAFVERIAGRREN